MKPFIPLMTLMLAGIGNATATVPRAPDTPTFQRGGADAATATAGWLAPGARRAAQVDVNLLAQGPGEGPPGPGWGPEGPGWGPEGPGYGPGPGMEYGPGPGPAPRPAPPPPRHPEPNPLGIIPHLLPLLGPPGHPPGH